MEDRYTSAMLLAAVGDAMGFKNGDWEFCFDGEQIHKELKKLGGIKKLKVKLPDFRVSDDTVLLLSTAEGLVKCGANAKVEEVFTEIAHRYKNDFAKDMSSRSGGLTTGMACNALRPLQENGWQIPFNPRGGGCGGAMRSMCIGLRYPNIFNAECLEKLIVVSVETGRMTHNHPTGHLGSFASALFGALSVVKYPTEKWGFLLLKLLPKVLLYIEKANRDVKENKEHWSYFETEWKKYLEARNLTDGESKAKFPEKYDVKERDEFYKSLAFRNWGGASGHDAPMIAYDGLLYAQDNWELLCHHAMLHSGDNDSTGVIAGFCYGAMYGRMGVPEVNYKKVEYHDREVDAGKKLFLLATDDKYLEYDQNMPIPFDQLFTEFN